MKKSYVIDTNVLIQPPYAIECFEENDLIIPLTKNEFIILERTNGLSYAAKYMKDSPFCWQVTLLANECERSELAPDAVKRLNI